MKPAGVREITYTKVPHEVCGLGVVSWDILAEYHFAPSHPYYSRGSHISVLDSELSGDEAREKIRRYRADDERAT